jgi:hypothetical protein
MEVDQPGTASPSGGGEYEYPQEKSAGLSAIQAFDSQPFLSKPAQGLHDTGKS